MTAFDRLTVKTPGSYIGGLLGGSEGLSKYAYISQTLHHPSIDLLTKSQKWGF